MTSHRWRHSVARAAWSLCAATLVLIAGAARAGDAVSPPPDLASYQSAPPIASDVTAPGHLRQMAVREAAVSLGMRGGLAHRSWELQQQLAAREGELSRTFSFSTLLIAGPMGMTIEPPVLTEERDARRVEENGARAAVARRRFRILQPARFVATPRSWRTYLIYDPGPVDPINPLLAPQSGEHDEWARAVAEGWKDGVRQADEIFAVRLSDLETDFAGMLLYRQLLVQGLVTAPVSASNNRGVTSDGTEMLIDDTVLTISGPAVFQARADRWRALPFASPAR